MKAWLLFFTGNNTLQRDSITTAISDEGIYIRNYTRPSGPGILVFDEMTSKLCNFLKEASREGHERILAIASSRNVIASVNVWRLLQAGASDVICWDSSIDSARNIAARLTRWSTVDQLLNSPCVKNRLVGNSFAWITLLRQVVEFSHFTDASILITGESGTGKELVAQLVHEQDQRPKKKDIVTLDCTTIVPELSGSEFFGHERGAFTGAITQRNGAFALADGGTLFLDEVGELPLSLQAQLLRVVQEGMYKRVGSNTWQKTSFRLVCATNKNLLQEVKEGRFRYDLYYRIAICTCHLPTLAKRTEDILLLARYFMKKLQPDEEVPDLDEAVWKYLLKRKYPGNVRDLKQMVSRIMYRHVGSGPVTVGEFPEEERPSDCYETADWHNESFRRAIRTALDQGVGLKDIGRTAENTAVQIAVTDEGGNLQRAAHKLRITDRALQMRQATRRQPETSHNKENF